MRTLLGGIARSVALSVAALPLWWTPLAAQELPWRIIVHGNVTTSSQIFPSVDATDPVVRAQSYEVSSSYGYGAEVRYIVPSANVAIGLSADFVKANLSRPLVTAQIETIPVSDGYSVIPIELTGYFIIPFSGKVFGVYMGAGGGVYIGSRTLAVGNVYSASASNPPGGGLHVLGGVSYSPWPRVTILGEMKFRDVQFKATNTFPSSTIEYQGRRIAVTPLNDARIYTDGVIFQLGIGVSL